MLSLQARELEKEHLKQTVEALKKFIFGGNSHGDTKDKDKVWYSIFYVCMYAYVSRCLGCKLHFSSIYRLHGDKLLAQCLSIAHHHLCYPNQI